MLKQGPPANQGTRQSSMRGTQRKSESCVEIQEEEHILKFSTEKAVCEQRGQRGLAALLIIKEKWVKILERGAVLGKPENILLEGV